MSISGPPTANGDENRQGGLIATAIVLTVLASVVVALRMITRIWIVRNVGWDDYTIVCAAIGKIVGCGLLIVRVHYGFGRHKVYLTQWQVIEGSKYSYGEWIQGFQTLMLHKISICFLLLRIPVEKHFIRPIQGAIALISVVSDFVLALFPIALLWKVPIQTRIKVGLCILMSLGLITAACCIVRTVTNWQNVNSDSTWTSVDNWRWRAWEVFIGIVAACIPPLRPGYRVLTSGIKTYLSNRSFRKSSSGDLVDSENLSKPASAFAKIFHHRQGSHESALEAAAYTVSVEARRAQAYGADEDGFAMQNLPGDKKPRTPGVQKTTRIDNEDKAPPDIQSTLSTEDGNGGRDRDFV
ncbi:MAG: hypothetical protein L6R42_001453 [Xanthoria sp. 1 TBL-2021]|nr:MAG: hypothetical protein L6R42_001453 [Xanthoria sp. 1 TBL-2021]